MTPGTEAIESTAWGRWDLAAVVALAVAALALRVPGLSPTSLFLDDAWVAYIDRVDIRYSDEVGLTSVGFVAGIKLWLGAVGFSETAAQIPALFFGVAGVVALYLGVHLWAGRAAAVVASALLLVNETHVEYSTRVKQYTFDSFWTAACLVLLFWVVRRGRTHVLLAVCAAAVIAAVVSFSTVLASGGLFAAAVLAKYRQDRSADSPLGPLRLLHWLGATAAATTIIAIWYRVVVAPNITEGISNFWEGFFVDDSSIGATAMSIIERWRAVVALVFNVEPTSVGAALLGAVVVALIVAASVAQPVPSTAMGLTLILATALAVLGLVPLGAGRPDHHLFPAVAALIAFGATATWQRLTRRYHSPFRPAPLVVALCISVAVWAAANPPNPRPYPDNDARPLIESLEAERRDGDAIVVHRSHFAYGLYGDRPSVPVSDNYHYQPVYEGDLEFRLRWSTNKADPHRTVLARAAERSDRIWLLSSPIGSVQELAVFEEILRDELRYELASRTIGSGAILDEWTRSTDAPG